MNNKILTSNLDEKSNLRKLSSQIGIALIIFALLILLGAIPFIPVISGHIGSSEFFSFAKIINTVFSTAAVLTASAYLVKKTDQKIKPLFQFGQGLSFKQFLNYFCVIECFFFVAYILAILLDKFLLAGAMHTLNPFLTIKGNSVFELSLQFMSSFLIIPALKIFFCQGIILNSLKKYGNWFAIIISAILLASINIKLTSIVDTFFLGIILGFITIKSNSVLPSIILGAIHKTFLYAIFYGVYLQNKNISTILLIIIVIISVYGLFVLINNRKNIALDNNFVPNIITKERYKTFFSSLPVIVYMIYPIAWIILQIVLNIQSQILHR